MPILLEVEGRQIDFYGNTRDPSYAKTLLSYIMTLKRKERVFFRCVTTTYFGGREVHTSALVHVLFMT